MVTRERFEKIAGACQVLARRLRLVRINRNLIVFLIFLAISIIFWFMQALKDTSTATFTYNLRLVNVPKEVVFTSEVPKSVSISVSGRGWSILQYLSKNESRELVVDFNDVEKSQSKIVFDNNLWRRLLQRRLGNTLKYVSATPSEQAIYYSNGKSKRVPVVFNGLVTTELQHLLCGIQLKPDSIDVVAPNYLLDSISEVQTVYRDFKGLEDTLVTTLPLHTTTGIKLIPDSVRVKICVDLFTEKTVEVPIYCENIPNSKVLRTFPSKAKVTFHVSATLFNKITSDDFIVVVDYNEVTGDGKKCDLQIRKKPEGISHVRISPEQIEYVLEQAFE